MSSPVSDEPAIVGVVGLGTIGLPLATVAAQRGFQVRGLDVDAVRVAQVNKRDVLFELQGDLRALPGGALRASTDPAILEGASAVFVCVPTPVDPDGRIVLTHLEAAARSIGPFLRRGMLVVLESSVEVGTTRRFGALLKADSGLEPGQDFHLAYCPERYSPKLPLLSPGPSAASSAAEAARGGTELAYRRIPRVVGGVTATSGAVAARLYGALLDAPVRTVSSPEAAEASKLLENTFRDVNIALINEFAAVFEALGVDTYEVLRAASTKGFAFMAHHPGLVGGECIPVDTWYVIRQAERLGVPCDLLRATRAVNDAVPSHVADAVVGLLQRANVPVAGARVAILGTAYKPNVYDERVSPARRIAERLRGLGAEVRLCDPVVQAHNHRSHGDLLPLDRALDGADAAVLATDHDVFLRDAPAAMAAHMRHRLVADARNALDHAALRKDGFDVWAWGRAPDSA